MQNAKTDIKTRISNFLSKTSRTHKILIHSIIWLFFFLFATHVSMNFFTFRVALLRGFVLFSLLAVVFYFNLYVLIPRYLNNRKYMYYILSVVGVIILVAILNHIYDQLFNPFPRLPLRPLRHPPPYRPRFLLSGSFFILILSLIVGLFDSFRRNETLKKELISQKTDAELQLLKSQINPHFLFNTLNNIYTLSYKGSKKAPESIMSLSEIMRYMLYEATPEKVPVNKEINYLKSYIELEKLRIEDTSKITVNFDLKNKDTMIPPLLFIPFIENAFKHSRIVDNPDAWIHIFLSADDNQVRFESKNSVPVGNFTKDKTKGIGLENVKKRLDLLYTDSYDLSVEVKNSMYRINLNIFL